MPDWNSIVRERIAALHLEATAEADLAEELAQHLEERYREYRSGGATEEEAYLKAASELNDLHPMRKIVSRFIGAGSPNDPLLNNMAPSAST